MSFFQINRDRRPRLRVGPIALPPSFETRHLFVPASTAAGKSEVLKRLLLTLSLRRKYGDRCVVVDPSCSLIQHFLFPGDVILNPLDRRSIPWSPLAEIREVADAARIAQSIVPTPPAHGDVSWYGYGRELLTAALINIWQTGGTTGDLLDLLSVAAREDELKAACRHTRASTLFLRGNEKMRANAQAVLGPHIAALGYLPREAGGKSLSLRKWAAHRYPKLRNSWIWWPVPINQIAALSPLIAAQIAELVAGVLELPEVPRRRIFLIVDEFGAIGKIEAIEQALTLGRKRGLAAILAAQSTAQLKKHYGTDGAQILLSCLSSWVMLRAADAETAEVASRHIGDHEIEYEDQARSESGTRDGRSRSRTWTTHRRTERVFLPSEIQRLPDRQAIVTLVGRDEVVPIQVPLVTPHLSTTTAGFLPRPQRKPPQREAAPPTPAAPVSNGGEVSPPAPPADPEQRTAAAARSVPPRPAGIALDDLASTAPSSAFDAPDAAQCRHTHDRPAQQGPGSDDPTTS